MNHLDQTLLARAARTPLAESPLRALAAEAGAPDWPSAIERALAAGEVHAATMLGVAASVSGARLPLPTLRALLPEVDSLVVFGPLLSTCDDIVALVCALSKGGLLSWEREALCLYVASQRLGDAAPPITLLARVRRMLRMELSVSAALLVVEAARALADPHIEILLDDLLADDPELADADTRRDRARLHHDLIEQPLSLLPAQPPPKVIAGYTYVRGEREPGRNDACPCGSGKKYKKCCALRKAEEPPEQVSETGWSPALLRPGAARRVPMAQFECFRAAELARFAPQELGSLQLIVAMRTLAAFGRFEPAEAMMDELKTRADVPGDGDPEGYREELIDEAIRSGRMDVAERQYEQLGSALADDPRNQLNMAFARHDPQALALAETRVLAGLSGDPDGIYDVVYALLRHSPALGIFVARGSFSRDRALDNEAVLEAIQGARDDLALDPDEPYTDVLDALAARRSHVAIERAASAAQTSGEQKQAKQLERLSGDMQAARERGRSLEQELRERERAFEALKAQHTDLQRKVGDAGAVELADRVDVLEQERKELRARIKELKSTMQEGAEQRRQLRKQLAEVEDAAESKTASALDAARAEEREDAEEAQWVEEAQREARMPLRHQVFAERARAQLASLPREVAARALALCAALAAGEAHAFGSVKRLKRAPDTWSARVDRSHRVLFRVTPTEVQVAEVIARRDLEQAVERVR